MRKFFAIVVCKLGRAVGRAVYDHFHPKEETP